MNTAVTKQIGIWLDHSKAHFIGHHDGSAFLIETIDSPYERIKRDEGEGSDNARFGANPQFSSNNENRKNNTAQNELNEYFKTLESKLDDYDEILLFGPTTAKEQLYNRLSENKSFSAKTIIVQSSDKMTDNQLLAFVRDFYKV
jgi:molybdopterin converting factor small subunit